MAKEEEFKYTKKVGIPQYTPKGKQVAINDLVDTKKYNMLRAEIVEKLQQGDITKEEAGFLIMAATRHIKFKYSNIAEYYCNASEQIQRLFERSALVLLDLENAVKNEFTSGRAFIDMLKEQGLELKRQKEEEKNNG